MKNLMQHTRRAAPVDGFEPGFTLVELLVTLFISAMVMTAIFTNYVTVTRAGTIQRDMAKMQQDLRAAMYIIKNDLRNSGRNGLMDGMVGLKKVESRDTAGTGTLYPTMTITSYQDADGDGVADDTSEQTITYQIMDLDNDGLLELCRSQVPGRFVINAPPANSFVPLIEGIEDIGFAYAFDVNNDNDLDRFAGAAINNVIWAVDSDGDDRLDGSLDNNNDGEIDVNDDLNGDDLINNLDLALAAPVTPNNIRAVRIWLLARSRLIDRRYNNNGPFIVGSRVFRPNNIQPNNDQFRRLLLEGAVALVNIERRQ